jgi:uncharacterized protein YfaP (DUF2135 family)
MALRSTLFALLAAACSSQPSTTPATTASQPRPRAQVVAVPLTAPVVQIANGETERDAMTPPWSLTASDGSGLAMTRVDARAVVEGPLAYTELHLWFHNSEARRREGTFQITLPAHAAVSRFAMETDGQWMEAEVVERQMARRAYDDFLHRRQDPALLEKAPGNQFTAKVFPIPANGDKHIIISFSQELPGERYVLPLRGLPAIDRVDVALDETTPDGHRAHTALGKRAWQPDQDFVSTATQAAAAVSAGQLVAIQVAPLAAAAHDSDKPSGVTLLVDTSASRGLGFASYVRSIHELATKLRVRYGDALRLQIVAFDQDVEPIFRGTARELGDAADRQLLERGAAGASDLGQALASLDSPESRVVIVSDGVITAGAEHADLQAAIKALAARKVERVDVVLAGGLRDDEAAAELVHAGLPRAGAVLDLDRGSDDVATALGQPVLVDVAVSIAGADWVYPRTIPTLRPGAGAMVYARLAAPKHSLDVSIGGEHEDVALVAAPAPLVERAVAGAEIAELEQQLAAAAPGASGALRADIAKRSIAARVISSETAMLVLESDADYARYGIDHTALADVLVIGPDGIERERRTAPAVMTQTQTQIAAADKPRAPSVADREFRDLRKKMEMPREQVDLDGAKGEKEGGEVESRVLAGKDEAVSIKPGTVPVLKPRDNTPEPDYKSSDVPRLEPPPVSGPAASPAPIAQPAASPPPARAAAVATATSERLVDGLGVDQGLAGRPADANDDGGARAPWPPADKPPALTGELAAIEHALHAHDVDAALAKARDWHAREPGDVRALIGLGDALEAKGNLATAARMYGSIIDLFPGRADMRRFAGERLARVTAKLERPSALMVDTYRRAVADRPDHLTGHRLLAYALLRTGKPADAFAAILAGIDQRYPAGRFAGAQRVLADDAGMIGAAYLAAQPTRRKDIEGELGKRGLHLATQPSTRFILYWETDGNDVDFHIQDAKGNHAWYGHLPLASGGELYADITTGYGPECFAIPGVPKAGPYHLSIDYYSQGPMGYGMGLLEIQRFDGKGKLSFEDRPYVIMNDHAFVDLGTWK